jgi:hypothetical protein
MCKNRALPLSQRHARSFLPGIQHTHQEGYRHAPVAYNGTDLMVRVMALHRRGIHLREASLAIHQALALEPGRGRYARKTGIRSRQPTLLTERLTHDHRLEILDIISSDELGRHLSWRFHLRTGICG